MIPPSCMFDGWLVDRLYCWLVGRMVGRSVGHRLAKSIWVILSNGLIPYDWLELIRVGVVGYAARLICPSLRRGVPRVTRRGGGMEAGWGWCPWAPVLRPTSRRVENLNIIMFCKIMNCYGQFLQFRLSGPNVFTQTKSNSGLHVWVKSVWAG